MSADSSPGATTGEPLDVVPVCVGVDVPVLAATGCVFAVAGATGSGDVVGAATLVGAGTFETSVAAGGIGVAS